MTVIDKISFRFGMADEQFARGLYADWDSFCRRCVTDILEEFFSRCDNKQTYIEIELLELDLGGIPQERFYDEFPVRLREALERRFMQHLNRAGILRTVSPDHTADGGQSVSKAEGSSSHSREKRFINLLHYLEYGFCLPEWIARDFDIYEELLLFKDQEPVERLLSLLAFKPYIIERLFLQLGAERLAEIISLCAWLSSPALGQHEKKRYLATVLERTPQSVIRFIRETKDTRGIDGMAELLESSHVRRIMASETEHHAEVDLPEYWHRLYDWMLEYYPFNGVAMFGDKRHFRLHLNRRLLSFIRKRSAPVYLSKPELTVQFLLEVFGTDYYLTVLDIIYHNQRLNADGSPATGDSYAWELYQILLRLSLIGTERSVGENATGQPAGEKQEDSSADTAALSAHAGSFGRWLEDPRFPDGVKRKSLLRLTEENPELLTEWLKSYPERRLLALLAALLREPAVLLLAGTISIQLTETAAVLFKALDRISVCVSWLKDSDRNTLTTAFKAAVLEGIGTGIFSASDSAATQILRIAELLYREITGTVAPAADAVSGASPNRAGSAFTAAAVREFAGAAAAQDPFLAADDSISGHAPLKHRSGKTAPAAEKVSSLKIVLSDNRIPDSAKKRLVLQWFDTYRGQECALISLLQSDGVLEAVVGLLGDAAFLHIALRLAGGIFSAKAPAAETSVGRFIGLLADNVEAVAELVSHPAKDIRLSLISSLAAWAEHPAAASSSAEFAIRLLSTLVGTEHIEATTALLAERASRAPDIGASETADSEAASFAGGSQNDALWHLLIRMRDQFPLRREDPHVAPTAFKEHVNEISGIIAWLRNKTFTVAQKRAAFSRYMADHPEEAIRLVSATIASERSAADLWAEIAGRDWHDVLAGDNGYPAAGSEKWDTAVRQLINVLSSKPHTADTTIGIDTVSGHDMPLLPNRPDLADEKTFNNLTSWLTSPSLSDTAKSQQLRHYARWQPKLLWEFIRYSVSGNPGDNRITLRQWSEWLGTEVWLEVIAGVSLSLGETLRQITGTVSAKYPESVLSEGLIRFIAGRPAERIYYGDTSSVVREYISALTPPANDTPASPQSSAASESPETNGSGLREQPLAAGRSDKEPDSNSDTLIKEVETALHTTNAEQSLSAAAQPEYLEIGNAGLCLLVPWIPRLFRLLGLLMEDRSDLKDTEARIRAIFILQRLVTEEYREYKEQELAFNRLLTGCPFHVPLPKRLELTDREIQTAEAMLAGVKENWGKLKTTSIKGFMQSFIERSGRLERQEKRWILSVEERAYDVLLDSLPWSYSPARMPWLEKRIEVMWRNKNNFDYE